MTTGTMRLAATAVASAGCQPYSHPAGSTQVEDASGIDDGCLATPPVERVASSR